VTVIGEHEVSAAVRDQAELTHRIGERRDKATRDERKAIER
jgi:hypothetical protein